MNHGTNLGYQSGCGCNPCRAAHASRRAYLILHPQPLLDPTPTIRRVRALARIGWSISEVSRRCGRDRRWLVTVLRRDRIHPTTAARVAHIYDTLCMQLPTPGASASRTRAAATAAGWAPPLAWDDIDNDAAPSLTGDDIDDIDPVVVMRLLQGDRITSTKTEKEAAMTQWVLDGGSRAELCRIHGWHQGRYSLRLIEGGAA